MGLFYMARTLRRKIGRKTRSNKKSTRRSRQKIRGGMKITNAVAVVLGLIKGVTGMYADANDATLTLSNGEQTIVKRGWGGVYIDKKYIHTPEVVRIGDDTSVSIITPTDKGLSTLSTDVNSIFKPVKLAGVETKWVWIDDNDLCSKLSATSLKPKYQPNQNILKCNTNSKSKYLALPNPNDGSPSP